jgi:hypothetical protein
MLSHVIAYAGDCRIEGMIAVAEDERFSDALNQHEQFFLTGVRLVSHVDGHVLELDELRLERSDIFAIEALGGRGPESRRIHTVRHRLEVRLGPYTVLGQVHTRPGGEPLVSIGRRPPMIPLTNATIAFNDATGLEAHDVETLIVNRGLCDWVRPDEGDMRVFEGVPVAIAPPV